MKYLVCLSLYMLSLTCVASSLIEGEDGYRLWLKYDRINNAAVATGYDEQLSDYHVFGESETIEVLRNEVEYAFGQMGLKPHVTEPQRALHSTL